MCGILHIIVSLNRGCRSALGSDDARLPNGPLAQQVEETPGGTPTLSVATPQPLPPTIFPQTATVPVASGADPVPVNGNVVVPELLPPPAIQGMPPLSTEAMAGFASAARGVTRGEGVNTEGLTVSNGA